jgi:hypothetical protein
MPRDMDDEMEKALGELICKLNPYTNKMELYLLPASNGDNFSRLDVEVDAKYPTEWGFKGQPAKINTAVRLRYRYKTKNTVTGEEYWNTDYLLIGYEGTGGP